MQVNIFAFSRTFRQVKNGKREEISVNILKATKGITDLVSSMKIFLFRFCSVVSSRGGLFGVNYNIIFIPTKDLNGFLCDLCGNALLFSDSGHLFPHPLPIRFGGDWPEMPLADCPRSFQQT
ncbi:hypothetical protein JTE90_014844 [Oedothorax gibbosus]|uniref:Uncharacterized protein n=1 Tax=Oedothorax gibbosus TaxID=931172 RepID=A0AAV6U055_9ARAC|nr:hypothetical protein JTE90_014844 [Oedothorax gibbosus]